MTEEKFPLHCWFLSEKHKKKVWGTELQSKSSNEVTVLDCSDGSDALKGWEENPVISSFITSKQSEVKFQIWGTIFVACSYILRFNICYVYKTQRLNKGQMFLTISKSIV